jgi:hypothetical protein
MEPTQELVDAIYRERVLRARRTPPEDKLLDGRGFSTWPAASRPLASATNIRRPTSSRSRPS